MCLNIGYERTTYAEKRLFINSIESYRYEKIDGQNLDDSLILNEKELRWSSNIDKNNDIDLVHTFNSINYGDCPWVVTFETSVPRLYRNEVFHHGINVLEKDNCLAIIAMSQAALNIHNNSLKSKSPESLSVLDKKTYILHPPQPLIDSNMYRFNDINPLKLIFVSNQFFLKGGEVLLEALIEFRKIHNVELTLVTRFGLNDNVTLHDDADTERVKKVINENLDWITLHNSLPNEDVLKVIAESHLGIVLSFAETYGYVVLEMQAAGVPVVTTNIRAFPEMNSDTTGWLVKYPYKNGRLPNGSTREDVKEISESMKKQLLVILKEVISDNGKILSEKAFNCKKKIFLENNPYLYAENLKNIYSKGLENYNC
ncbi:glycosyltransferase family 4 protein [Psychrobacter sp. KFRI-CH2-11]|uniref:glycosyltransferase family 4 protein n=1 Tax=Psychrobacter sp. KFRI-CH2-11 TaxID=3156079 RepID=UPI00324A5661